MDKAMIILTGYDKRNMRALASKIHGRSKRLRVQAEPIREHERRQKNWPTLYGCINSELVIRSITVSGKRDNIIKMSRVKDSGDALVELLPIKAA